jgi:hypothetical protein
MSATYALPAINLANLPGAIVVAERVNLDGDHEAAVTVDLGSATIEQLKAAIGIERQAIARAAQFIGPLCNLLNRRIMQGAGDGDAALISMDDPVFHHDVRQLMAETEERYAEAMETYDGARHVDAAIKAAKDAFHKAMNDQALDRTEGMAWASIAMNEKNKPLIQALRMKRIGDIDWNSCSYEVELHQILKRQVGPMAAEFAAIDAFAMKLSDPVFEVGIHQQAN